MVAGVFRGLFAVAVVFPAFVAGAGPEAAGGRKLPLIFWDGQDVVETDGRIRFGAEPLRRDGRAVGYPEMHYACDAPGPDDGRYVYGWRYTNWSERSKRAVEVVRCQTRDGRLFTDAKTIFRCVNRDWQGFSNIVRRPADGALFLFCWAPSALHVFRSDDGIDWRLLTDRAYGDHDAMCVTWHHRLKLFVNYQHTLEPFPKRFPDNIGSFRRVLSFRRSVDAVTWTSFSPPFLQGQRLWRPDEKDPKDLELYRCAVFPCQGRYAMLLLDYLPHPQEANPRRATTRHSSRYMTEWAISRDGVNWQRPFRETDAVEKTIWTPLQGPFVHDGVFLFYSRQGDIAALPENRIFYAACRSNGFFSTLPFTMPSAGLTLNAQARYRPGEDPGQAVIMVEVQDADGETVPGYEMSGCLIENQDGRSLPLTWNGNDGRELAGRRVRLRFFLRDAKIYTVDERIPDDDGAGG